MKRVQPDDFITRKANDVEEVCLDKCIKDWNGRQEETHHECLKNCFQKVLLGFQLLNKIEETSGLEIK